MLKRVAYGCLYVNSWFGISDSISMLLVSLFFPLTRQKIMSFRFPIASSFRSNIHFFNIFQSFCHEFNISWMELFILHWHYTFLQRWKHTTFLVQYKPICYHEQPCILLTCMAAEEKVLQNCLMPTTLCFAGVVRENKR